MKSEQTCLLIASELFIPRRICRLWSQILEQLQVIFQYRSYDRDRYVIECNMHAIVIFNIHCYIIQLIIGHQNNISLDSDRHVTLPVEILLHTHFGRWGAFLCHNVDEYIV
jgi:hypothetical protein